MPRIISRAEWGTQYPSKYQNNLSYAGPWYENVWHTAAVAYGYRTHEQDCAQVRGQERFHVLTKGWNGIAYSHLLSPAGRIFEGRGWLKHGAHTEKQNHRAHGIQFMGHGDYDVATPEQIASAIWLVGEGIRLKKIAPNPLATGHFQYSTGGKSCPGHLIQRQLYLFRGILGPIPVGPIIIPEEDELNLWVVPDPNGDRWAIWPNRDRVGPLSTEEIELYRAMGAKMISTPVSWGFLMHTNVVDWEVPNSELRDSITAGLRELPSRLGSIENHLSQLANPQIEGGGT